MFTGLIQETGTIKLIQKQGDGMILRIEAPECSGKLKQGGSININGACQSAFNVSRNWFEALATSETVSRTNFGTFRIGDRVNLELPLTLSDPLGGHLVSGHVDDTGKIAAIKPGSESTLMQIKFDSKNNRYLIEKGSVAVDGISLTCFNVSEDSFSVSLIPDTIERTNLKFKKIGDAVNLEFDMIGKYIEKFVSQGKSGLTLDFLTKHGFMR